MLTLAAGLGLTACSSTRESQTNSDSSMVDTTGTETTSPGTTDTTGTGTTDPSGTGTTTPDAGTPGTTTPGTTPDTGTSGTGGTTSPM